MRLLPVIRPALPTDHGAIQSCAEQAFAPYIAVMGRRPAPMDADYGAVIKAGQVRVAQDAHHHLLGFIVYYPQGTHMFLDAVAVRSDAKGQGIGKALITHCEDAARNLGLGAVHLYTNAKMVENLSLYPRLGYREVDRRQEHGFDRVYFEKPLI